MKLSRVLIVYKKSAYETYFRKCAEPRMSRLQRSGDKGLAHIHRAHSTHYGTLTGIEKILRRKKIRFDRVFRGTRFDEKKYDLILTAGGDGTFLDAARYVRRRPIMGLNTDESHSVGQLCSIRPSELEKSLNRILEDRFTVKPLHRLALRLNGKPLEHLVLNDVLFCHTSPAAMSHYYLSVGGKKERQRSSGVWISTAAGSTGAMRSAGGRVLPLTSDKIQYKPRELFAVHGHRYRVRGGVVPAHTTLTLVSQMEEGALFIDGARDKVPLRYGDTLRVKSAVQPIYAVSFTGSRQRGRIVA